MHCGRALPNNSDEKAVCGIRLQALEPLTAGFALFETADRFLTPTSSFSIDEEPELMVVLSEVCAQQGSAG